MGRGHAGGMQSTEVTFFGNTAGNTGSVYSIIILGLCTSSSKISTVAVHQKDGCALKMEDSYHANLAALARATVKYGGKEGSTNSVNSDILH